jgi:hypothetical protein
MHWHFNIAIAFFNINVSFMEVQCDPIVKSFTWNLNLKANEKS